MTEKIFGLYGFLVFNPFKKWKLEIPRDFMDNLIFEKKTPPFGISIEKSDYSFGFSIYNDIYQEQYKRSGEKILPLTFEEIDENFLFDIDKYLRGIKKYLINKEDPYMIPFQYEINILNGEICISSRIKMELLKKQIHKVII